MTDLERCISMSLMCTCSVPTDHDSLIANKFLFEHVLLQQLGASFSKITIIRGAEKLLLFTFRIVLQIT